jgi:TonB-dependent receptor
MPTTSLLASSGRRTLAALTLLGVCSPTLVFAAAIGGRVTALDRDSYVAGAQVTILGDNLRRETTTNSRGEYAVDDLPAGTYRVRVSYLSQADAEKTVPLAGDGRTTLDFALRNAGAVVLDPFVVEAVAEGQAKAINQQRNSDTILAIISADAAGALPDQTIGQALNRLAGVNVVDDTDVSIRGADSALNTITLDGIGLTTPRAGTGGDETRAFDLSSIPTEMIESIEVYKVLTPDMPANSFGGTVNLKTRSSLDYKRAVTNASIEYQHDDFRANYPKQPRTFRFTAIVGRKLSERWGVSLSANLRQGSTFTENQSLLYYSPGASQVRLVPGLTDEGMNEIDRQVSFVRSRQYGLNASVDFQPTRATRLSLKLNLGATRDVTDTWRARIMALDSFDAASTAARQSGHRARMRFRPLHQEVYNPSLGFNLGGTTKFDSLKLSYQLAETYAVSNLHQRRTGFDQPTAAVQQRYDWTVDRTNVWFPVVRIVDRASGQDIFDRPQDMSLEAVRYWDWRKTDYKVIGRIDAERPFRGRFATLLKAGINVDDRRRLQFDTLQDWAAGTSSSATTVMAASLLPLSSYVPRNLFQGAAPTLGAQPNVNSWFDYLQANRHLFYDRTNSAGNEFVYFKSNQFTLKERVSSGYVMSTTDFGRLRALGGYRYELSEGTAIWEGAANGRDVVGSVRYGNHFPGASLIYNLTTNQKLRAAWSSAVSRPNLTDMIKRNSVAALNPGADPELLQTPGTYNLGNPNLKAQRTLNYDLSYELYYQPAGLLSVQAFNKHITNFIFVQSISELRDYRDPVSGEVRQGTFTIQQPVNGGLQEVRGLEISWQQNLRNFSALPKALQGLGLNTTATFLRGKNTSYEQDPVTRRLVPVTSNYLISQPSRMYNAQLYWDYRRFTARVAVNSRDSFRRTASTRSNLLPIVQINAPLEQWSFKTTYRLTRVWGLFFSGRNLSREYTRAIYQNRSELPVTYSYRGLSLMGGARCDF